MIALVKDKKKGSRYLGRACCSLFFLSFLSFSFGLDFPPVKSKNNSLLFFVFRACHVYDPLLLGLPLPSHTYFWNPRQPNPPPPPTMGCKMLERDPKEVWQRIPPRINAVDYQIYLRYGYAGERSKMRRRSRVTLDSQRCPMGTTKPHASAVDAEPSMMSAAQIDDGDCRTPLFGAIYF